jgi:hypothetical protein
MVGSTVFGGRRSTMPRNGTNDIDTRREATSDAVRTMGSE